MTTEATPAGVYVRDTNGARHWVWRDAAVQRDAQ